MNTDLAGIENLRPVDLIRLLFKRADELMAQAEDGLNTGSPEAVRPALLKAQEIISELLKALDFEKGGELAENLRRLYIFVWERLVLADLGGPEASGALAEARQVWGKLSAAWEEVDTQARS